MIFILILIAFFQTKPAIHIENSWIRNSSKNMNTAVFFEIVNSGRKPDTLYNVTSDLAKLTEVHQSFEKDGQMGMRKVPLLVIPAKSTVYFKPGSYHVMLIKLKKDMKEGNIEEVSLHFKQAGEIKVKSVVKI